MRIRSPFTIQCDWRRPPTWLLAVPVVLAVAGCNTVAGFGEDLQTAGGELEETAERQQAD